MAVGLVLKTQRWFCLPLLGDLPGDYNVAGGSGGDHRHRGLVTLLTIIDLNLSRSSVLAFSGVFTMLRGDETAIPDCSTGIMGALNCDLPEALAADDGNVPPRVLPRRRRSGRTCWTKDGRVIDGGTDTDSMAAF